MLSLVWVLVVLLALGMLAPAIVLIGGVLGGAANLALHAMKRAGGALKRRARHRGPAHQLAV